jgi:hypothetical protein
MPQGWGYSLVVKHLPNMCKVLGLISSNAKQTTNNLPLRSRSTEDHPSGVFLGFPSQYEAQFPDSLNFLLRDPNTHFTFHFQPVLLLCHFWYCSGLSHMTSSHPFLQKQDPRLRLSCWQKTVTSSSFHPCMPRCSFLVSRGGICFLCP